VNSIIEFKKRYNALYVYFLHLYVYISNNIKFRKMAKERNLKQKSDKKAPVKTAKEKKADKIAKKNDKGRGE